MEWVAHFGDTIVETLSMGWSNHLPILLNFIGHEFSNRGRPRPFCLEAKWLHDDDGEQIVIGDWQCAQCMIPSWNRLQMKLHYCRRAFTKWEAIKRWDTTNEIEEKLATLHQMQL